MPNKRIFYASHVVEIGDVPVIGAQSVSVNTNYNLEQIFQLGRLAVYDQIATDPEVEITISKVIDGYPTIFNLATYSGNSIVAVANDQRDIILGVGNETDPSVVTNTTSITMTGCYINSLNYTFPVDGNFTEEVTFVGSHKAAGGTALASPTATAPDGGHVRRRQHFLPAGVGSPTKLPPELVGRRLSSINISTSFNREKMFALGQYSPFHRFVNFPIEVTVSFDVIQDGEGDLAGIDFDATNTPCEAQSIETDEIVIALCGDNGNNATWEYKFDLGSGCSLQSVSYSGGDTGGGNVTETWTYVTYNDLTITENFGI